MRVIEFIKYLSKSRYMVKECPVNDYLVFSGKLYLGTFQPDRDNIAFWFDDDRILPARDFMLDDLDISEMRIRYPYRHIFIIKGFKHV